jgi:site-specific DNA recombinase
VTAAINPDNLYVEFKVKHKSGKAWIIKPDEVDSVSEKTKINTPIFMDLVKAHMWRREIERGAYKSIRALACAIRADESYVKRIARLNRLAPQIKEMILDGKLPEHIVIRDLTSYSMPILWTEQLVFLRRLGC